MKTLKFISSALILVAVLLFTGCADDDDFVAPPTSEDAAFSFSFDPENPNRVIFNAEPSNKNWYTHWDFGDNSSTEGYEATKVYLSAGDYNVRFKVFTKGGTAESIQTVVINGDFQGPNILLNGEFNGGDEWTVLPISDGVDVNFNGDKAVWTGGNYGQVGIYQPVHVEANVPYQIDMEVSGSGLTDSWYEVYIGAEAPVPGQDYSDGGIRLGLNTWAGCGNEPFDGKLTEIGCVGEGGGLVEFNTTGTVYFVVRGGGADYGASGLSLDNVTLTPLVPGVEIMPPLFPPTADFSFSVLDGLTVEFTNASSNADSYFWDFGDGVGTSSEENPTYTYTSEGIYTVTLSATNSDGTTEASKNVAFAPNLIGNGEFDDDSVWSIIQHNGSGNGEVTIANGVAVFDEVTDIPSGSWGNEAHVGINQAVTVDEAGTYALDMNITTNGIDELWFEVWVGTDAPTAGADYNENQGGTRVLNVNSWDCGNTVTYSGSMAATGCTGVDGTISLDAGTYYVVIRSGGFTFGEGGVIIDNVSMVKVN
jgi:PKD repeat protein